MTGETINNYILERKLGEGGMGDVYFARHNRIDRVVAVKVLHQNLFTNENIRSRFKNEANALIKLGHPGIVKIYDYVEQDDFACLIMALSIFYGCTVCFGGSVATDRDKSIIVSQIGMAVPEVR